MPISSQVYLQDLLRKEGANDGREKWENMVGAMVCFQSFGGIWGFWSVGILMPRPEFWESVN